MREIDNLIIGAGISGLSTAWELQHSGAEVELWESSTRVGGKIATDVAEGFRTEQSASMVLNFRPEVSQFLVESELNQYKLLRTPTEQRYIINQDKLINMPVKIPALLNSPIWSTRGKLRLMVEPFIRPSRIEGESVADFIRRRLGSEMLDKAMGAYISGTLASDPELADSRCVLPQLTGLERRFGSITAGVFMNKVIRRKTSSATEGFSFKGGMSTMIETLRSHLANAIHTGYEVTHIEPYQGGWQVSATSATGNRTCLARNLILSTPAAVTAKLVAPFSGELQSLLNGIEYAPVSIVHMGYKRKSITHDVRGTGFLTPFKE